MLIHLVWIGGILSYCISYALKRLEKMTCMVGMMTAMTFGMLSSLSFGIILGAANHDITRSSVFAVVLGVLVGFTTGQPVSLMAAIDGITAGVMGGLMGGMLGSMIHSQNAMMWFVDGIFALIMALLLVMIRQETSPRTKANRNSSTKSFPVFLYQIGIFVIGLLVIGGMLKFL
ncbi:hypothetical protein LSG31_03195 [Fodinisporobacter ferrooxydans]|uniref:Uncharacterized protein n=1 Tax=Fodinisporobacter ferrooxydans TaxID=2901836 RepID=A0ABY4CPZ5_9BACL|nr:hypothetical protein LSG31_03195 [Alicyclobacillaceae bacterium MYW30-H2]